MADTLGWRTTFGVVTPSPNRVVQPEYDGMRPVGVTNHLARMAFSVPPVSSDKEFQTLVRLIDEALEPAIDRVMTATPDHLILGVSVEAVWHGLEGAEALRRRIRARAGIDCTTAAEAVPAALAVVGGPTRIAVSSPYTESGNAAGVRFFAACGSGVGSSVAANKIPGVGAGLCTDPYSAHEGVEHDNANVLVLGARVIGTELAHELVKAFLAAEFTNEERHRRRLEKVNALETRSR